MIQFTQDDISEGHNIYNHTLEFDDNDPNIRKALSILISTNTFKKGAVQRLNELGIT